MAYQGGCACGQVRYAIKRKPMFTQVCHCTDCQRTTGSAFVVHAVIARDDLQISGDTRMADLDTGSGAGAEIHFCSTCATYIWLRYKYHQVPVIAVRAGTLDNPSALPPQGHIFLDSMQDWVVVPAGVPAYPKAASREEMWPAEDVARYDSLPPI
jgi:hypothetical protein